jgi:hypothetical protein
MASSDAEGRQEHGGRRTGKPSPTLSREDYWLSIWSIARYDLGLSSDEFYAMTPRMLDALLRRKERESWNRELLFGQLVSVFINHSMSPPKKAASPADFMPSEILKRKRRGMAIGDRKVIDAQARDMISALMKQQDDGEKFEQQRKAKIHNP